ncbi:MAG: serine hydrolase [Cyanobacteria bacterium J06629_19]
MTDANGTRNTRTGSQGSSGAKPHSASTGASADVGRPAIQRPKLNLSSSRYVPASSIAKTSATGTPVSSTRSQNPASPDVKSGERPNSRYRAAEERPTRRRRSQSGASASERRRIFGTVPDRIKRKSSSRTRALKAKTTMPSRRTPKKSASSSTITKKTGRESFSSVNGLSGAGNSAAAGKRRPTLPNSAHPGRVPASRGLVRKRRRASRKYILLRRGIQLLIAGIGLAAIGGTLLKVLPETPEPVAVETAEKPTPPPAKTFPVAQAQEIPELKAALQELPNLYPNLTPKVFYIDVDTGSYINVEGTETVAAASTIKLPILLAFFEEIDAGRIDPNQTMAIQPEQIAEGSGDMQLSAPGTQFTALEVATQMIVTSDNTATNMMIDLLGGREVLNKRFQTQGLEKTVLNAPLPDLEGTNKTSARDLVHTMLLISEEDDLTVRSRDRVLNILNRTRNKSLLANGPLDQGALTYNKTGDIASVLGDVALVDLPNGKRYAIAALVERPTNDGRAQELINRISGQTYREAAKAVQPAVTPLGDADSNAEGSSPPGAEATPGSEPAAPSREPATPEEEPYPSANPRN